MLKGVVGGKSIGELHTGTRSWGLCSALFLSVHGTEIAQLYNSKTPQFLHYSQLMLIFILFGVIILSSGIAGHAGSDQNDAKISSTADLK